MGVRVGRMWMNEEALLLSKAGWLFLRKVHELKSQRPMVTTRVYNLVMCNKKNFQFYTSKYKDYFQK